MNWNGKVSKLIIPLLLLPLFPFLGLGYFALNQISEFQGQKLAYQMEQEAHVFLGSLLFSLKGEKELQPLKLLDLLSPIRKDPHSTYIIVDTQGNYLVQSQGLAGWSDISNLKQNLQREFGALDVERILSKQKDGVKIKDTLIFYIPIILPDSTDSKPLAFLLHISDFDSISLESPFIRIFLMLFLMGALLSSGIWLFYTRSISRPLKRIIQANRETTKGSTLFFEESEIPDNEFGLLMRSRDSMLHVLRKTQNEIQSLVEKNHQGILIATPAGTICFSNVAADHFLGNKESSVGQELDFILSHDLVKEIPIHLDSEQELGAGEARVEKTEWRGEPHYLVNIVDITQRKNTEESRLRLESELYQAQKMEAIGTLASGIAHDFNNTLAPIIGFTERVQKRLLPESEEAQHLTYVLHAANHAKGLVSQILNFSRKDEISRSPLQLQFLIKEVLSLLSSTLPTNIKVQNKSESKIPAILGNANQLHQVLMNLCVNASHAMPEGGTLTLKLCNWNCPERRKIQREESCTARICLSIQDTGTGMEPETLNRIFDPFFTTKEAGKGTGLGLSMVQKIMKQHEGSIEVQSTPGEGTCFFLSFPASEDAPVSEIEQDPVNTVTLPAAPQKLSQEKHIFFVDDDAMGLLLAKTLLEDIGYQVTTSTDNIQALELFSKTPEAFDLLLTDYSMPNMNGIEFSQKIREFRPDIPVVLCTGHNQSDLSENLEECGINAIVTKPYNLNEFQQCLQEVFHEFTL